MHNSKFYCISSRVEESGKLYGCFKIGPFLEQHSLTFANALRRTLLVDSSTLCFAIQIYGIEHEFSTLPGIRESVLDIMANLEALSFQITQPLTKPKIAFLNFSGPGILQAQHIHLPSGLKCVQPSQYIATVEVDGNLMFKLLFSPKWLSHRSQFNVSQTVTKVNYTLKSGLIFFEVWTNGSIHPQTAILNAINTLLLEIFPYSQKISKFGFLAKKSLNEKLLNLEMSNFYLNLETYLFFKKKKIHRIIDLLNFVKQHKLPVFAEEFYNFLSITNLKGHS
uniref:Plastid-encoded RNA polymerase subunit alpha n=1 Tax=Halimeda discoidea TaxID=118222 RepID=A0A1C9JB40_9CHLO|nr:RNA polymerase a-subunit [Halimeda discoidea]